MDQMRVSFIAHLRVARDVTRTFPYSVSSKTLAVAASTVAFFRKIVNMSAFAQNLYAAEEDAATLGQPGATTPATLPQRPAQPTAASLAARSCCRARRPFQRRFQPPARLRDRRLTAPRARARADATQVLDLRRPHPDHTGARHQ